MPNLRRFIPPHLLCINWQVVHTLQLAELFSIYLSLLDINILFDILIAWSFFKKINHPTNAFMKSRWTGESSLVFVSVCCSELRMIDFPESIEKKYGGWLAESPPSFGSRLLGQGSDKNTGNQVLWGNVNQVCTCPHEALIFSKKAEKCPCRISGFSVLGWIAIFWSKIISWIETLERN